MARVIEDFEFANRRSSGKQKYPWAKWMNGQIWVLTSGTPEEVAAGEADFAVSAVSFASNATSYGKRHAENYNIKHTNIEVDGNTLYLQAVLLPEVTSNESDE